GLPYNCESMRRACCHSTLILILTSLMALATAGFAGERPERVRFRLPHPADFRFERSLDEEEKGPTPARALVAHPDDETTNTVEFGDQVVVQTAAGVRLEELTRGSTLTLSRQVSSNVFILQARSAAGAIRAAQRLAGSPKVEASYPIISQDASLDSAYAPRPSDPYFVPAVGNVIGQWNLENRDPITGLRMGPD